MDCTVADWTGIRILSKVVQCASKIGDDMTFTASATGLVVRTINASHSACATFVFRRPFFSSFRLARCPEGATSHPAARVPARALMPVLRNPASIQDMRVSLDTSASSVIFRLTSKTAVRKTFLIAVHDGGLPAAIYDKSACASFLRTRARFLLDVLANFHTRLEEVIFNPRPSGLQVQSHVDPGTSSDAHNAMLRTEMTVDSREFDSYQISSAPGSHSAHEPADSVSLTFFCKPFRAALEFCEALEATCNLLFSSSGQPFVLAVEVGTPGGATAFDADFVFATRLVNDATQLPVPGAAPASYSAGNDSSSRGSLALAGSRRPPRPVSRRRPKLALTPALTVDAETAGVMQSTGKRRRAGIPPSAKRPPRALGRQERDVERMTTNGGAQRPPSAGSRTGASGSLPDKRIHAASHKNLLELGSGQSDGDMEGEGGSLNGRLGRGSNFERDVHLSHESDTEVAMPTQYGDLWNDGSSKNPAIPHSAAEKDSVHDMSDDDNDSGSDCVPGTPPPE